MRWVLVAIVATLLLACGANDRESCLAEAATKPTDMGVRVAVAACYRKFPNAFDQFDSGAAKPGGYSPSDRLAQGQPKPWEQYQQQQPGEIDKFLGTSPSGGLFDDLIPRPTTKRDFARQMLPVSSVVVAVGLVVIGALLGPISRQYWLIRAARWVCLTACATQGVSLLLTLKGVGPSAAPPVLEAVSIGVLLTVFFAAGWLINWLHARRFGTPHPKFADNPWAL